MERTKSIGIWIRVSTEFQVKDESPEHHEKRARLYCEAKGWHVAEVYHLDAVSGKSVMEHPEAKRMLRDVQQGRISGLVFSKLARLARNTRELLEFSERFRSYNADLISLSENIDTSTSAGRLFYTMIAAMAEWERQEIAERVAASVPIRAKMGKPLGGAAPFGYAWSGKELTLNEHEAPIRRLMYELFMEHKRKGTVANRLNSLGYRTRNGSKFTDTTIGRLLHDPIAKGIRIANYTKSTGDKKHWTIKPESEWVQHPCPAIISEEVWETCKTILASQEKKRLPAKKPVHLFAGILKCSCGGKMYVPSRTSKYSCTKCKKRHIAAEDIESIYYDQLHSFLLTRNDLQTVLDQANDAIAQREQELQSLRAEKEKVKKEMDNLIALHGRGQIPTEDFGSYYKPFSDQHKELENAIIVTESQIDLLRMHLVNGDHILDNAERYYEDWPNFTSEQKQQIIEEVTDEVVIDEEDITITFYNAVPPAPPSLNPPNSQRNFRDSYWR